MRVTPSLLSGQASSRELWVWLVGCRDPSLRSGWQNPRLSSWAQRRISGAPLCSQSASRGLADLCRMGKWPTKWAGLALKREHLPSILSTGVKVPGQTAPHLGTSIERRK